MEGWTIDHRRDFGLPAYFKAQEGFYENISSMLRLIYVMEGNGVIKLNGEILIISAPALLCLNELDEIELQQSIELKAQAVYFYPALINDLLQLEEIRNETAEMSLSEYRDYFLIIPFIERVGHNNYIELGPITSKKVACLFESVKEELTLMESEFWPCRCRSFFLEILFLIQYMVTDSKNKGNIGLPVPSEDISNIILYLHTNYDKKVTIEELTDMFHINRTTLSDRFRKAMGLSIMEYLIKYRIKIASVMLRDTRLTVNEILSRVGFTDGVHFSRMFKKHTGYTPSGYREKYERYSL